MVAPHLESQVPPDVRRQPVIAPGQSDTAVSPPIKPIVDAARRAGVLAGVWPDALQPAAVIICLDGRSWAVYPDPAGTGDWITTPLTQRGELTTNEALRLPTMRDESYPATWWETFLEGSAYLPAAGSVIPPQDAGRRPGRTPAQLMAPLIDLARQLSAMATLDDALAALPRACVGAVPGAQHAAVTRRRSRDRYSTIASTGEIAAQTDRAQYAINAGPCLDALTKCAVVRTGNLPRDRRWPSVGARIAAARGVTSVLSTRLPLEGEKLLLSVNLYSCEPHAFDAEAENTAVLLAWQAAVALRAVRERERADQLAIALQTNRQIAKAIGLLMARLSVSDDEAFDFMKVASQHTHRRLTDIAESVLHADGLELSREWLTSISAQTGTNMVETGRSG